MRPDSVVAVSAIDLAALLMAFACMVAVAVLVVAAISLARTLKELRSLVCYLREEAVPLVEDLRRTARRADDGLSRIDGVIGRVEQIAFTVDRASRIALRAFAPPLAKAVAL